MLPPKDKVPDQGQIRLADTDQQQDVSTLAVFVLDSSGKVLSTSPVRQGRPVQDRQRRAWRHQGGRRHGAGKAKAGPVEGRGVPRRRLRQPLRRRSGAGHSARPLDHHLPDSPLRDRQRAEVLAHPAGSAVPAIHRPRCHRRPPGTADLSVLLAGLQRAGGSLPARLLLRAVDLSRSARRAAEGPAAGHHQDCSRHSQARSGARSGSAHEAGPAHQRRHAGDRFAHPGHGGRGRRGQCVRRSADAPEAESVGDVRLHQRAAISDAPVLPLRPAVRGRAGLRPSRRHVQRLLERADLGCRCPAATSSTRSKSRS